MNTIKVEITRHARKRFKERLGLPKRCCKKQANKAYNDGFKHSQANGRAKKYIDGLYLKYRKANNIRIYNESIYIFVGSLLITVFSLPVNLKGHFK